MIHRIYSNLKSFRELQLTSGLNVLLADKSKDASDKQTRNGAGKTSLIELIHFVLGGNVGTDSIFRSQTLALWNFGLDVDIGGERIAIERSGGAPARIKIASGNTSNWSIQPKPNRQTGALTISNAQWKSVLAELAFGLPSDRATAHGKFSPTFRSLLPYFVRRQDSDGFLSHDAHSSKQAPWDRQVGISFILGFDWSVSQRFQLLREQEKVIKQLKASARKGVLPGFRGSAASLRTQVTLAEAKADTLKQQLDAFNVVPEYESIEREATQLTRDINRLSNENTADRQLVDQLNQALGNERAPEAGDLESVFLEAEIVLPDLVTRRLAAATEFHQAIIRNRRAHLRSEIARTLNRIDQRDGEKAAKGARLSDLMRILESGGALDQYTLLQDEYSRLRTDAEALKQQLVTAERLESAQTKAEIERRQLQERLRQDFHEREAALEEAIVLFEELSKALYERERTGSLTVDATENGPIFEVHIDAKRSHGITNMQVFCFDMMMAVIVSRWRCSPGFLVHDSHLFDGVDERQVARALQIGREFAEECGFQYLVTMNSDVLPRDGFDPGFDINEYINPLKLDDTPQGGLFGVRFN